MRHRAGVISYGDLAIYRCGRAGNNCSGLKEMKSYEEPIVRANHLHVPLTVALVVITRINVFFSGGGFGRWPGYMTFEMRYRFR